MDQLASLLEHLSLEGFKLTLAQRIKAYQLWGQIYDPEMTDARDDRNSELLELISNYKMLAPIICTNPEQQRKFRMVAEEFLSAGLMEAQGTRVYDETEGRSGNPGSIRNEESTQNPKPTKKLLAMLVSASFLAFILANVFTIPRDDPTSIPTIQITSAPTPPPVKPEANLNRIELQFVPQRDFNRLIWAFMGLGALAWAFRKSETQSRKQELSLKNLAEKGAVARVESLVSPQRLYRERQLFRDKEMKSVAKEILRLKRSCQTSLDLPRTVQETVKKAGLADLYYKNRRQQQTILLLIERQSGLDHLARLIHCYFDQLRLPIEIIFFKGTPWTGMTSGPSSRLDRMAQQLGLDQIWIAGELDAFSDGLPDCPANWIGELGRQSWETTVITVQSVRERPNIAKALETAGIRLLPFDNEGVIQLGNPGPSDYINSLPRRPNIDLSWSAYQGPGDEEIRRGLAEIRFYLNGTLSPEEGNDRFEPLEACAFLPELRFALTLELIDEKHRVLSFLVQLFRLPWFRSGQMPEWLRKKIVSSLTPRTRDFNRKRINDSLNRFDAGTWELDGKWTGQKPFELTTVPVSAQLQAQTLGYFRGQYVNSYLSNPKLQVILLSLVIGVVCGLWERQLPWIGGSGLFLYLALFSLSLPTVLFGFTASTVAVLPYLSLTGHHWAWSTLTLAPVLWRGLYRMVALESAAARAAIYKSEREKLDKYLSRSWLRPSSFFWLDGRLAKLRRIVYHRTLWNEGLRVNFADPNRVTLPSLDILSNFASQCIAPSKFLSQGPQASRVESLNILAILPLIFLLWDNWNKSVAIPLGLESPGAVNFSILGFYALSRRNGFGDSVSPDDIINTATPWVARILLGAIYCAACGLNFKFAFIYLLFISLVQAYWARPYRLRPPQELLLIGILLLPAIMKSPWFATLLAVCWLGLAALRAKLSAKHWVVARQALRVFIGVAFLGQAFFGASLRYSGSAEQQVRSLPEDSPLKPSSTVTPTTVSGRVVGFDNSGRDPMAPLKNMCVYPKGQREKNVLTAEDGTFRHSWEKYPDQILIDNGKPSTAVTIIPRKNSPNGALGDIHYDELFLNNYGGWLKLGRIQDGVLEDVTTSFIYKANLGVGPWDVSLLVGAPVKSENAEISHTLKRLESGAKVTIDRVESSGSLLWGHMSDISQIKDRISAPSSPVSPPKEFLKGKILMFQGPEFKQSSLPRELTSLPYWGRDSGYEVLNYEGPEQVRYFYPEDRAASQKLLQILKNVGCIAPTGEVVQAKGSASPGQIEVWLSTDLFYNNGPVKGQRRRPLSPGSLWSVTTHKLNGRVLPNSDAKIITVFPKSSILETEVGRGGSDSVLVNSIDSSGKPWMRVRDQERQERSCYVRASLDFITPVQPNQEELAPTVW